MSKLYFIFIAFILLILACDDSLEDNEFHDAGVLSDHEEVSSSEECDLLLHPEYGLFVNYTYDRVNNSLHETLSCTNSFPCRDNDTCVSYGLVCIQGNCEGHNQWEAWASYNDPEGRSYIRLCQELVENYSPSRGLLQDEDRSIDWLRVNSDEFTYCGSDSETRVFNLINCQRILSDLPTLDCDLRLSELGLEYISYYFQNNNIRFPSWLLDNDRNISFQSLEFNFVNTSRDQPTTELSHWLFSKKSDFFYETYSHLGVAISDQGYYDYSIIIFANYSYY